MIHRQKRDLAASLLEQYWSGKIRSDDLANDFPFDKGDPALDGIFERLWFFWDDRPQSYNDKQSHPAVATLFQRGIAFLRSDLEYEWPLWGRKALNFDLALLRLLGFRKKAERIGEARRAKLGATDEDMRTWPFRTKEDLQKWLQFTADRPPRPS